MYLLSLNLTLFVEIHMVLFTNVDGIIKYCTCVKAAFTGGDGILLENNSGGLKQEFELVDVVRRIFMMRSDNRLAPLIFSKS